ncbi:MAG: hypothetical protein OQK42_05565 [Sedimenticola sp.]|nr:hypothetical protein [Sedimenticola sp.]MCW8883002.1 hypothetical protein [Sedimenticola sp.]MCW8947057.1 hypothetical protein [Sedimenticola sp.]MCW8950630.1 hypothetical protein [Sedimenticola sp.]MCW8976260.1 hypothetical protein [Sedimenticola sp.]
MKTMAFILVLTLLAGCQQQPIRRGNQVGAVTGAVSITEDLQSLMDFSDRFQSYEREGQLALCAEMRAAYEREANRWTGWYLATAISQVDGCGTPQEAIGWIQAMLKQRFVSSEVSWLAHYQIRLLQYQQQQQQQLAATTAEQKKLQRRLSQMDKSNSILEKQLQDLKRIETSINRRLDEKHKAD